MKLTAQAEAVMVLLHSRQRSPMHRRRRIWPMNWKVCPAVVLDVLGVSLGPLPWQSSSWGSEENGEAGWWWTGPQPIKKGVGKDDRASNYDTSRMRLHPGLNDKKTLSPKMYATRTRLWPKINFGAHLTPDFGSGYAGWKCLAVWSVWLSVRVSCFVRCCENFSYQALSSRIPCGARPSADILLARIRSRRLGFMNGAQRPYSLVECPYNPQDR